MNDRIGTVSNDNAAVGLFRASGDEIDTNYIDGKTEGDEAGIRGRMLLTSRSPDGNSACTAWYPEGHAFSRDEKKAAVEEFASRLGVSETAPTKKHRAARAATQTCGGGFVTNIADAAAAPSLSASTPVAAPQSSPTGSFMPGTVKSPDGLQAIPVRDSAVHLIDAPYEAATATKNAQEVTIRH